MGVRAVLTGFLALLLLTGPAEAANPAAHDRFVRETDAAMERIRNDPADRQQGGCASLQRNVFDLEHVARQAADQSWAGMDASERAGLLDAISRRLTRECISLIALRSGGPPVIRRVSPKNGNVRVTVEYRDRQDRSSLVAWTLVAGGPFGMRALDATIDGRGVISSLRAEFAGALLGHGGNVEQAIDMLARSR